MSGFLNVTINDRSQADPIAGAKVIISEYGASDKIIKVVETNSSGQANHIELASDNERYSAFPYKKYDLTVQIPPIPGRYSQPQEYKKSGVQIWNNRVTNNQDELVQIRQLESIQEESRNSAIEIEDNSIVEPEAWKEIQNALNIPDPSPEQIELLPTPGVSYLLPPMMSVYKEPFIPTRIDIYLGKANPYQAGGYFNKNNIITEDYRKYLKIVCAQEFGGINKLTYEAGVANFLLVNSFALNRIYTEMYRNSGYPFNITNSTAFDQHYPKGGTTFEFTDGIVEKYFNKYIKLKGKRQPLLAQYCAGKSGSCSNKGIPQIGLNYRSIQNTELLHEALLKEYFDQMGIEFEIVTAEVVEGNPKSYPGTELKLGSSGGDVSSIQEFLKIIKDKYPSIPAVDVTGEFDAKTQQAVIKFQDLFMKGKPNKGIVDEATWYKMSAMYVDINKMIEGRARELKAFVY